MTLTAEPRPGGAVRTPESQNLDSLQAMLDDPTLAGFHDDIRESIARLIATSVRGGVMTTPDWKIEQPPVEEMMSPVRCTHCRAVYSLTHVHVTGRYTDCSVWTSPCCGVPGIDDRPWVRDRHYREVSREEAARGDFYDVFGMRHRW